MTPVSQNVRLCLHWGWQLVTGLPVVNVCFTDIIGRLVINTESWENAAANRAKWESTINK